MEEKRNRLLVLLQRLRQIRKIAKGHAWRGIPFYLFITDEAYMLAGEDYTTTVVSYPSKRKILEVVIGRSETYSFSLRWGEDKSRSEFLKFIQDCIEKTQQKIIDLPYGQDNKQ